MTEMRRTVQSPSGIPFIQRIKVREYNAEPSYWGFQADGTYSSGFTTKEAAMAFAFSIGFRLERDR